MKKEKVDNSESFRVSRHLAQADHQRIVKEVVKVSKEGKLIRQKRSFVSANENKITDSIIDQFQKSFLKHSDYYRYAEEAYSELGDYFEENGLNATTLTRAQRRFKAAAIRNKVDEYIYGEFSSNPSIEVTTDQLIVLANLPSSTKFSKLIEYCDNIPGGAKDRIKRDIVDMETVKVTTGEYITASKIVSVVFELDPTISEHFSDVHEFLAAETLPDGTPIGKKRKQYIKKIRFELNRQLIPHFVAQGRDYVMLDKRVRNLYRTNFTHTIDNYLTSIQSAQHIRTLTDFKVRDFMNKYDYNYKRESEFLSKILDPAIQDFNDNNVRNAFYLIKYRKSDLWVRERRRGSEIEMIRFVIENYENDNRSGVDPRAYYTALQTYSDKSLRELYSNERELAQAIQDHLESNDALVSNLKLGKKSIQQWFSEASEELQIEQSVIELLNLSNLSDIYYDHNTMSLQSTAIDVPKEHRPSVALSFLKELLKGSEALSALPYSLPFDDGVFIKFALDYFIKLEIPSPVVTYLEFIDSHKRERRSDWKLYVKQWVKMQNVFNPSLRLKINKDSQYYIGEWHHQNNLFMLENRLGQELSLNQMCRLLSESSVEVAND